MGIARAPFVRNFSINSGFLSHKITFDFQPEFASLGFFTMDNKAKESPHQGSEITSILQQVDFLFFVYHLFVFQNYYNEVYVMINSHQAT